MGGVSIAHQGARRAARLRREGSGATRLGHSGDWRRHVNHRALQQCRARAGGSVFQADARNHLAHLAGSVVIGLGAAGIAWWRMPDKGEPGPLVIWAVVIAIFFAGAVAARLVGVFTTPSGRLRDASGRPLDER